MSINTNTGSFISEAEAITFTHSFQTQFPTEIKAFFAGKNKILDILAQTNCIGIRIYNALNTQGAQTLVIVGVNSNEEDMTNGHILEYLEPCPKMCAKNNVLIATI